MNFIISVLYALATAGFVMGLLDEHLTFWATVANATSATLFGACSILYAVLGVAQWRRGR